MSAVNTYLKNATLMGGGVSPVVTNVPPQYATRQRQYFDPETRLFTEKKARYSSDFVVAQVQGLDPDDMTAWGTYRMRFAEVVRPSSAIQRHFDDYKQFLFESREIEYVRPGTKIITMGNTWLVTNPANISGASGSGICRRCNAVWNYLDYYGNVISEPIVVENERANANDSDAQNSQLITKGYFNVICQYNDATRQIDTNTRFILGTAAYRVTGYSDFETEFTGDYSTLRLLSFTVRYEEPNEVIDDMVNHVAGGKNFSWDVFISADSNIRIGETARFEALSVRNNRVVDSTEDHPISYLWESSDSSVITIDEDGYATAIAEGEATITGTLEQNHKISMSVVIDVTQIADGVEFTSTVPDTLDAFETTVITASYYEDGGEQPDILTWEFSGANKNAYSASVDGNTATITCYGYSDTPLRVTALHGAYSASEEITLEGI